MFATVSIKKFPREYLDQVISCGIRRRPSSGRAPDPGLKLQASRSRDQGSSFKLQAASLQHLELDRSLIQGYSRIKKKEKRTYAKLNASRPRTVVTRRKYCSRNCSALEATDPGHKSPFEPKAASIKRQASSPELQASSFKPQASSSMILDPRYI